MSSKRAKHTVKHLAHKLKNQSFKGSPFSRKQLSIFGLAFVLIGGYFIFKSFAAPAPSVANLWVDKDGGSCERSPTPVPYDTTKACGTSPPCVVNVGCGAFDQAWDKASAGDTIVVKPGVYDWQNITGNKASTTKIIGEDGVVVKRISGTECEDVFGGGSAFCFEASNIWVENMIFDSGSSGASNSAMRVEGANATAVNIRVRGDYPSVGVSGANFTWRGGELGDPNFDHPPLHCFGGGTLPLWFFNGSSGSTIDGIYFPKRTIAPPVPNPQPSGSRCGTDGVPHLENIRFEDVNNITIKNAYISVRPT